MRGLKKVLTGILAATMIMGSALNVSAATVSGTGTESVGTITVENAEEGQTYSIYKILDFQLSADETESSAATGVYKLIEGSAWNDFIKSKTKYFSVDANGYVVATTDFTAEVAQAFAKEALQYANDYKIAADAKGTADEAGMTFTNLGYGYFLMDSTTGVLCSLDTSTPSLEIEEKNGVPTVDKEVKEGDDFGSSNDAEIGDTVEFRTTITAQAGAQNYALHDTMTAGLTFDSSSVVVKVGDTTLTAGTDYTLVTEPTDGCTFEVKFNQDFLDTITAETSIYVTYSATVNADAVIASDANTNETYLKYGEDSKTEKDTTTTYTYKFDIIKYTGTTDTKLAGATFSLYRDSEHTDVVKLVATEVANTYRVATKDDTTTVTEFTTDDAGQIFIEGLDEATYYLVEVEAPTGYTKLTSDIVVKITKADTVADGSFKILQNGKEVTNVLVENKSGSLLPSTGGMGTTIFYIVGICLVVAACAYFIFRRKAASLN
ncbi:MAG: LPXTG cell wall anchor domain-containing protein [Butyrivibrio sp.]|nr:LPXTG cell wall anchor domain-containing protein [Butyrivibrio sp.]